MLLGRLRPLLLALAVPLGAAYALTELAPPRYVASASVLQGQRLLRFEHVAADPREAERLAALDLATTPGRVIDAPSALPAPSPALRNYALAALAGLALGAGLLWHERRRRRPVRNERELVATLGQPLLAARPSQDAALRGLAQQLLEHWFTAGRALLPVVSAGSGEGRTRLAAQLASVFAEMGVRTLLIDADLRSPGQHREFGLGNRRGLAEFLEARAVEPATCGGNLAVLVAGRSGAEPLELLSRERLRELLAAAAKPFRVVLVDTPAAARGPDFQIFAALAGGALVVSDRARAEEPALRRLRALLKQARARVVATVLNTPPH